MFGEEYVSTTSTGEAGAAKGGCTRKFPGGVDVATTIYSYACAIVPATTAHFACPGKSAIAVMFGDEYVRTAGTGEAGAAKGGCSEKFPGGVDVTAAIYADASAGVVTITACFLCPIVTNISW